MTGTLISAPARTSTSLMENKAELMASFLVADESERDAAQARLFYFLAASLGIAVWAAIYALL